MNLQIYIDQELKKLCPIHGMSFPNLEDKRGWRIDFKDEATPAQRQAAIEYVDKFVWDDVTQARAKKKEQKELHKDNLVIRAQFKQYKDQNPSAKFDDFLDYLENLPIE